MGNHKLQHIIMILILVIMMGTAQLYAASESVAPLTLEQALRLAMDQSPNTETSRLEHQRAEINLEMAWRNLWPKVNLQSSYVRLDEGPKMQMPIGIDPATWKLIYADVEGSPNVFNTQLSFQQPLFMGGKVMLGIEMAELGVSIAEIQARQTLNDLFYQVIQSYFNVLMAEKMLQIQQNALTLIEEHLRIVQVNYDNGLALKTELLKVELEKSKAQQNLRSSENACYLAKRHLGLLLGRKDAVQSIESTQWLPQVDQSLNSLLNKALTARPELQLLQINLQMLKDNLQMERRSFWPNVILVGNYKWQDDKLTLKDGNWNLTLSASMPLFDGGVSKKKYEEIQIQIDKAEQSSENLSQMILLEIEEALLKADEAQEALISQEQNLTNAVETMQIAKRAYELGVGTSIEVLNAQIMVQQAEVGMVQSEYQYQLGLFKILYKTGQLVDYCKEVIYHEK